MARLDMMMFFFFTVYLTFLNKLLNRGVFLFTDTLLNVENLFTKLVIELIFIMLVIPTVRVTGVLAIRKEVYKMLSHIPNQGASNSGLQSEHML